MCQLWNVKQKHFFPYRLKKSKMIYTTKNISVFTHHRLKDFKSHLSPVLYFLKKKTKKKQLPAVDPSQLANQIALAFSVPVHLMTCWRLMSRALQGQGRYLLCPATMTVKTCLWSSGWNLSSFFSRFALLNDGMENGEWGLILKYQFLGRSRIICRLSVSCVILLRFDLL